MRLKPGFADHSEGPGRVRFPPSITVSSYQWLHPAKRNSLINYHKFFANRSIQLRRLILLIFTIYSGCLFALYLWRGEFSQALSHLATAMLLLFFWSLEPLTKLAQQSSASAKQQ